MLSASTENVSALSGGCRHGFIFSTGSSIERLVTELARSAAVVVAAVVMAVAVAVAMAVAVVLLARVVRLDAHLERGGREIGRVVQSRNGQLGRLGGLEGQKAVALGQEQTRADDVAALAEAVQHLK